MKKEFCYENISGLHLELTTKCNAMCPMCNRNFKGKIRKNLPLVELSIDDIKQLLPPNFVKQLKLISLCGVYGEPICNKDVKKIIEYFYNCNENIDIDLYTNGSLYDTSWWIELANIMKGYNGTVIFGIDGIGDVHELHRCNTNYNKILENARAFISAGGKAQWDFIVFKHNEYQVDEAKELSEKLGFESFQIKKTSRFFKNFYENDENLDSTISEYGKHPVYDCNGDIKYYLELPDNKLYHNGAEEKFIDILNNYSSIDDYLDSVLIDCDAIKSGGIFLSAQGEFFPCCTVYQQVCYKKFHDVKDIKELNEFNLYINDNLSGYKKTIKNIVEGFFFKELLKSFKCGSIVAGKPKSCSRACGVNMDVHAYGHTTKIKSKGGK